MGKKINPLAFRPNFKKCQWFTSNKRHFAIKVLEDYQIRKIAEDIIGIRLFVDISIERIGDKTNILINTHKPSVIIMSKNEKEPLIEKYKKELNKKIFNGKTFQVLISEVMKPEINYIVIANNIAEQLEARTGAKIAMKRAMSSFIRSCPNGGIRIICSGRVGGAEIARSEKVQEGKMPLASIKANVRMAIGVAHTVYGTVSVKVYTYIPRDYTESSKKYDQNRERKVFRKSYDKKDGIVNTEVDTIKNTNTDVSSHIENNKGDM